MMKSRTPLLALATAGAIATSGVLAAVGHGAGTSNVQAGAPGISIVAPTGAPDYRAIVARYAAAVVGVTVEGKVRTSRQSIPDFDEDPFFRFYRNLPFGQAPRPDAPVHGQGSGFIVSPDGVILTNAHVVRDAKTVTVKLADRREFEAKVLGVDPATDVAVLKIAASGLPTVTIGDPGELAVGDYVLAIGSPFGFEQSATSGIVSAKRRSLPGDSYVPFIQTDVAVNPGNSGGPLFDAQGKVVGINSQIWSRTGGYQGLSFAIPIDVAVRVRDQILANGQVRHARLGVTVQELNQALAESFRLDSPDGALVSSVAPGSAAEKAGLHAGDVVLAIDGVPIERSGDLAARVGLAAPGDRMSLSVVREGKRVELKAVLGESEDSLAADDSARGSGPDEARLGVAVRPLSPAERQAAGVPGGLLVEEVGGAARRAGIEPGDVILSVNGKPVASVEQLRASTRTGEQRLALLVQRGEARIFVPVRLG